MALVADADATTGRQWSIVCLMESFAGRLCIE